MSFHEWVAHCFLALNNTPLPLEHRVSIHLLKDSFFLWDWHAAFCAKEANRTSFLIKKNILAVPLGLWDFRSLTRDWTLKILWRRKWQPTPVFLPEIISQTEEPCVPQSMGSQSWTQLSNWAHTQLGKYQEVWLVDFMIKGCLIL